MPGINISQPDVTLMLDLHGVIRDVVLCNAVSEEAPDGWVGQRWVDTVGAVYGSKVSRMLEDARERGVSAFREVTQRFPSGLELPMEYTTVRLGGRAGLIAIGRSLHAVAELQSRLVAAQQAMEQDYWKLREVESRYRLLFDSSTEAVVVLSASTLRVVEANPAAIRSLGLARGWDLLTDMSSDDQEAFHAMLARVRQNGRSPGCLVHIGAERVAWTVRASLMTGEPSQLLLLQLAPASGSALASTAPDFALTLDAFADRLPDAFVIADVDGRVRRVNRAFLDMVQLAEGAALGQPLGRWLSRPGADATVLLANIRHHGVVRRFVTALRSELAGEIAVEIAAVPDNPGAPAQMALLIRDIGRRLPSPEPKGNLQAAFAAIIEQTGKMPLKTLVGEAVGLIERHYIAAALEMSSGNRTAAAELLGLSRQSFYKKIGYYGLDLNQDGADDLEE